MNYLDYVVLLSTILGIAAYGIWRTRGPRDLHAFLKGPGKISWLAIGISVMATQASAITFLSTPGQGYQDGLGFVQNYFGMPFALILIAAVFLPIYRKLDIYTAYEFLGKRFDSKTRLLGAALFLFQRGIGAGITVYAPAIVLSTVMGWPLNLTILSCGLVVIVYTVVGGSEAVTLTQKYQFAVIMAGMFAAFVILMMRLPGNLHIADALTLAGSFHKMQAVDFSVNVNTRYTFWSGLLGGIFLHISYFGCDQSQVQRYISGSSLRESRLGLMFNAICKIPMQFFILLLGVMLFIFFQFNKPPLDFDQAEWAHAVKQDSSGRLASLEQQFSAAFDQKQQALTKWLNARQFGNKAAQQIAQSDVADAQSHADAIAKAAQNALGDVEKSSHASQADYVFIDFILAQLPHGLIGLLVAAFFAAALSSKAAELNALASTTTVDFYRHLINQTATDRHYVIASKCFTVFWGLVALAFAMFIGMKENLIQAGNIVGSVFYGVPLALFLTAFFFRWISGTAIFWAALISQAFVIAAYYRLDISYLWYNLIGCAVCIGCAMLIQLALGNTFRREAAVVDSL